jgi:hypothetical protein
MSVSINGTNGLTFNDGSTQTTSPFTGGFGFRNRIINGDMRIDQRNAGASVTLSGSTQFTVDRFPAIKQTSAATVTAQRSTVAPAGFTNSLLFTVSTGAAPAAGDINAMWQVIEGFNAADFGWGTANAQSVAMSFWVRSSITGTYAFSLNNSASNRFYAATFTISSANTWEYKTVTIAGDTSGTWLTDNGAGVQVTWDLGYGSNFNGTAGAWGSSVVRRTSGSVQLFANTGATWQVTGVQLEKGSTATSFDYRPYAIEEALCQRYFQKFTGSQLVLYGYWDGTNSAVLSMPYPVTPRTSPTGLAVSSASHFIVNNSTVGNPTASVVLFNSASLYAMQLEAQVASGGSLNGKACRMLASSSSASIEITGCEL